MDGAFHGRDAVRGRSPWSSLDGWPESEACDGKPRCVEVSVGAFEQLRQALVADTLLEEASAEDAGAASGLVECPRDILEASAQLCDVAARRSSSKRSFSRTR
jgi:hypothetical protein